MDCGPVIEGFATGASEVSAELVQHLASVVRSVDESLECAVKWGRLTFASLGDYHHWICGIGVTKKAVVLTFHFGGLLADPDRLFISGTSRFGRKLEFRGIEDVDDLVIADFVSQAIDRLEYFKGNWKAIQSGEIEI